MTIKQESIVPQLDWVVLERIEHEDKTASGLYIAQPGDYEGLKTEAAQKGYNPGSENNRHQSRTVGRYKVISVGPGAWADVSDDLGSGTFLRKPMCTKEGDTVLVQAGVRDIFDNTGKRFQMCQDFDILAVLRTGAESSDPEGGETIDVQHDYIMAEPSDNTLVSKGGIVMPQQTDQTGNNKLPDRWRALAVGEGPWALQVAAKRFMRRPMPVAPGDIFTATGAGFAVIISGCPMLVIQAFQVAAVFQ